MIVSRVILENWRNFRRVDVELENRVILIGPNASGKSNFLDVFRFLRDIAKLEGGGLQKAINERGGLSKIRCLAARQDPEVRIEVHLAEVPGQEPLWKYAISIRQESRGARPRQCYLTREQVWKGNKKLIDRPYGEDKKDRLRLTQTFLEQINANQDFREIAKFLDSVLYLHLVPQLLRYPEAFSGPGISGDPFGRSFLERVARTPEKTRKSRLKKIETGLRHIVPQLKQLTYTKDEGGVPHLEAVHEHWRPKAGKQREDQFSDGTLRLIGLFWSLLEGDSLLLLEEPELSLHSDIVAKLPELIVRLHRRKKRQVILSTHSADLLADKGIGGEEILVLMPEKEGTEIQVASSIQEVRDLLEGGLSPADAILPRTTSPEVSRLRLSE